VAAMRKVLECRLPAIIAKRRATGRANMENSNTIREGVLWRTKLGRLLRRHRVMRQTHLCLKLSVLLPCHQTKAIGYWTADTVTTLLAHNNASLPIRRFPKETTVSVTNNFKIDALGRGDVTLNGWDAGERCGKTLMLHNVPHVPDCGLNCLLSISQLRKLNLLVDFHRNGGPSLRREGKKSSWINAMEIDGL